MNTDDVLALWRGLNASLAFMAFWLVLLVGVKPKFRGATREMQYMMMTTLALLFTALVGSIEQALGHAPLGFRVPLLTAALIWANLAMTVFREDK